MNRPDPRQPGWAWLITVAVVAVLVASGVSIVYTDRALKQLCGLVNLLADDQPAPSTARGVDLLHEAQKLQRQYRCR